MITSVQNASSSSTISSINIDLKLKSKDTIRGHPHYLSRHRRLVWWCNSSQNWHGVIITSACTKIRHPLWPRKAETIICKIIHHSPPMRPYLHTIYQDLFQYQNVLFNDLVGKKFYIQEGSEGASSIIDVDGLIYCDKKMNYVYYGTTLKLALHLHTGKLLQF